MANVSYDDLFDFDKLKDANAMTIKGEAAAMSSIFIEDDANTKNKKGVVRDRKKNTKNDSYSKSDRPYAESYIETNNALRSIVNDIDATQLMIDGELEKIRKSKTMAKKFDYIASLSTTKSQLFSSKITALREIDSNITQSHNLELKREKDLKMSDSENDTDKAVFDMYKAIVNTPKSEFPTLMNDLDYMKNHGTIQAIPTVEYQSASNELTPQQNMMILSNNPNIKTVLIYNRITGDKWFDVIDITTGEAIPNTDKPRDLILKNIQIDLENQIAREPNLDITYPLIMV